MKIGSLYKENHKDLIIICTSFTDTFIYGVVVKCTDKRYEIGHYDVWYKDKFVEFNGQLDLNNVFSKR